RAGLPVPPPRRKRQLGRGHGRQALRRGAPLLRRRRGADGRARLAEGGEGRAALHGVAAARRDAAAVGAEGTLRARREEPGTTRFPARAAAGAGAGRTLRQRPETVTDTAVGALKGHA